VNSGYLWPLFKKDCQDSMSGIPAMSNLLYFNLFEKAMSELPIQKRGCYLQENQGWEFGFISAWRSAKHNSFLIGFPHSTIRYWDLRYFFDSRSYKYKDSCDLPIPDYIGVNGGVSKNAYLNSGFSQDKLIEVEALRYLYLHNFSHKQHRITSGITKYKMVLIVGDYLKENTCKQLNLISEALTYIDQPIRFIIKPHPAHLINMSDFPNLPGELSTDPIEKLLIMSDIVYASLITSAAVDAYCVGLPVVILFDGKTLNTSPLRGVKGVCFTNNANELANAINIAKPGILHKERHYFYLNPDLPGWNKLLSIKG
jgi:surface carbohydrate biosynthesis protein (TIGR04326 family)